MMTARERSKAKRDAIARGEAKLGEEYDFSAAEAAHEASHSSEAFNDAAGADPYAAEAAEAGYSASGNGQAFEEAFDEEWRARDPDPEIIDHEDRGEQAKPPDRLRLVPPSEMDWRGAQLNLVKGILGHAMMALLYGASGSAKTLIALSLALHVALGREWCGRAVKKGFVAYLAPEGGHSVHLRFHAWCRHHRLDPSDDTLPFRTVPVRVDLCKSDADLKEIIANIKAAEPELGPCTLAVVDTVSRALDGGDENSPADMGNFVANCDRMREATGATVLGVHHTPKEGDNPRGHTCLKNGSEIRMLAKKVANSLFSLNLEHLKDGAAGDELLFELESAVVGTNEDGEEVSGGLVIETDIRPAGGSGGSSKKPTERQLRIFQELHKEAATSKKWEFTTEEFGALCIRSGAIDGEASDHVKRSRRSDLRMQLANRGWITVNGDIIRIVSLNQKDYN